MLAGLVAPALVNLRHAEPADAGGGNLAAVEVLTFHTVKPACLSSMAPAWQRAAGHVSCARRAPAVDDLDHRMNAVVADHVADDFSRAFATVAVGESPWHSPVLNRSATDFTEAHSSSFMAS